MRNKVAVAAIAVGMVAAFAPAASAQPDIQINAVICEDILPPSLCAQIGDTYTFVKDTAGRIDPILDETREIAAQVGDWAWATIRCYLSGPCSPITS